MPPKRVRGNTPTYTPSTPPKNDLGPMFASFFAPSSHISVNQGAQDDILKTMLGSLKKLELGIEAVHHRIDNLNAKVIEHFDKIEKHVDDRCEKVFNEVDATHEDVKGLYTQVLEMDDTLDGIKVVLGEVEDRVEIFCDEHENK